MLITFCFFPHFFFGCFVLLFVFRFFLCDLMIVNAACVSSFKASVASRGLCFYVFFFFFLRAELLSVSALFRASGHL